MPIRSANCRSSSSLIPTLEDTPVLGVIIGAVLTVLSTSSLAIVLLTVSLGAWSACCRS